jgi:uncharacterized protein YqeY
MLELLKADKLAAFKSKDKVKTLLLSTLIGDLEKISKDKCNNVVDSTRVTNLIVKFVKGANEVLTYAEAGTAQYEKAKAEIEILSAYLPKALSREDTRVAIFDTVATLGSDATMGNIMKLLKEKHGNKLDGKLASGMIKEALGG